MRRKMAETYPTFFDDAILYLVVILGVSSDSGRSLGLEDQAKLALFPPNPERILANDQMASQNHDPT